MGVEKEHIWVDPGIGFGKRLEHNLALLGRLEEFRDIGGRLVIGTSRKSFLGMLLGDPPSPVEARGPGTLASNLWAYSKGATVFRVHDVASFKRALKTWEAIAHG
jgi:dihydropteroate synthase